MIRSLYSAISGLKNHQTRMDVIGNNIANVDTTGFKRSRVSFAIELSQTLKGASASTPTQGGTNAMQVGMGMRISSIDQIMSQGSSQTTGKATDMMLQGTGFFVLDNNGQEVFTRTGGFGLVSDGTLIDPGTGAKVQGYSWGTDDTTPVNWGAMSDIRFKVGDVLASDGFFPIPEADGSPIVLTDLTSDIDPETFIYDGLDSLEGANNLTIDGMVRVTGFPASGQFSFDPVAGTIQFASDISFSEANPLNIHFMAPSEPSEDNTATTAIVDYPPALGASVYIDGAKYTLAASDTPKNGEYTVKEINGKYQINFGTNQADGNTPTGADTATSISYDFTNKPHTLIEFNIDQSGVITGVYSNGDDTVIHKMAQIAIATFANEEGLQNVGGNFYTISNNSGMPNIGAAGEDGRATVIANSIEMSNVDLSTEFTDMIVTQRGFQANSRLITVSDTLLEELVNLKR